MLYNLIFISLYVVGWSACGFLPWLTLSVATRGQAGLAYLPLCVFAGNVAGLAVPILILDDATGLWLSFLLAALVPAALLAARRLSLAAAQKSPAVPPPAAGAESRAPGHDPR